MQRVPVGGSSELRVRRCLRQPTSSSNLPVPHPFSSEGCRGLLHFRQFPSVARFLFAARTVRV
jgi:hypothetical protein